MNYCNKHGVLCSYTTSGGDCKLSACGYTYTTICVSTPVKTNREWLNSLTNKELADFLTFGLPVKQIGTGQKMVINQRTLSLSGTLSDIGVQNWLSKRQEYEVWKNQDGSP